MAVLFIANDLFAGHRSVTEQKVEIANLSNFCFIYLITEWWPLYMVNVLREWTHCPTSECHWIRWALENSGGELSVWRNGIAFSWYCSRRWKFTPLYISKLFILQGLDHMKVAKGLIFTRHPSLTWNISPLVAQSGLKC